MLLLLLIVSGGGGGGGGDSRSFRLIIGRESTADGGTGRQTPRALVLSRWLLQLQLLALARWVVFAPPDAVVLTMWDAVCL